MKTLRLSVLACAALMTGFISCSKKEAPLPPPAISSFAPMAAFSGDTVIITGTNLNGTMAVSFGGSAAAWFAVSNATTIKAVVGSGATGDVKVVTGGGAANLAGFTLNPHIPSIAVTDSIEIPFRTNKFTLYSFKDSAVVSNNDSATTKWDIGIRFVSIILNSHTSGPGNAGAITQSGIYNNFTVAPESGYAYDDTSSSKSAIDDGLTTGWYNYDDATHVFSPKAGKFFVIRTADNHYVKMEITAVNYAGYTPPSPTPTTLIYKFRYTYQSDGSRNF